MGTGGVDTVGIGVSVGTEVRVGRGDNEGSGVPVGTGSVWLPDGEADGLGEAGGEGASEGPEPSGVREPCDRGPLVATAGVRTAPCRVVDQPVITGLGRTAAAEVAMAIAVTPATTVVAAMP